MLASSLVYVLVPFALRHQETAGVLAVGPLLDTTVPPTPDSSRTWASPDCSPRAGASVLPPQEAPPQEDPLPQGGWTGLPLVGGILASALNAFLPFVAARRSLARIFRMSIPVALWGAAWWFTLPGWNPGLSFLGSLLDKIYLSPLQGVSTLNPRQCPLQSLDGGRIGTEKTTVDLVYDNTSVNGGNGVFVEAAMDHLVGAQTRW